MRVRRCVMKCNFVPLLIWTWAHLCLHHIWLVLFWKTVLRFIYFFQPDVRRSLKDLAGGRPVVINTVSGTTIKQRASVKIDFKLSATSPDPIFCPAKALTILVALNWSMAEWELNSPLQDFTAWVVRCHEITTPGFSWPGLFSVGVNTAITR